MKARTKKLTVTSLAILWCFILYGVIFRNPEVNEVCREEPISLEEEWQTTCLAAERDQKVLTRPDVLHFVSSFSRQVMAVAGVVRMGQALAQAPGMADSLHWVLVEVVPDNDDGPDCLPGLAEELRRHFPGSFHHPTHITHIVQRVDRSITCLTEEKTFHLGTQVALRHLMDAGAGGMVHFSRLEAAYPLGFFEEVDKMMVRPVLAFPVVSLLRDDVELFAPITKEEKVVGFVGNMSKPFALLSLVLSADLLRDGLYGSNGIDGSRGNFGGHIELSQISSLDPEQSLAYHLRSRPVPEFDGHVRVPDEFSGKEFNLDQLVSNLRGVGAAQWKRKGGGTPLTTCRVDECQKKW